MMMIIDYGFTDDICELRLGPDRDAARITGSRQRCRVQPVLDAWNLSSGESYDVGIRIVTKDDVEVVEVAAGGAHDHDLLHITYFLDSARRRLGNTRTEPFRAGLAAFSPLLPGVWELNMSHLIEVENLVKTYQTGEVSFTALQGISLEIDRGDFVAIMGPSGSGKSTFMNILGCLDLPTSGKYRLNGIDIQSLDRDANRQLYPVASQCAIRGQRSTHPWERLLRSDDRSECKPARAQPSKDGWLVGACPWMADCGAAGFRCLWSLSCYALYREHEMQAELEAARTLAVRAGAILLEHYSAPGVCWKGRGNPVTEADRAASAFLVREFKRLFATDRILSEEESDDATRLGISRVWIVDPLDGTLEFIDHRDEFAVMIGLSIDGTASLGVVYQPATEKLYYATSGGGAFLIENRSSRLLQVSPESNPLAMTLALSRSHHSAEVDDIQRRLRIQNAVTSGSIGLKVGLICEGRAHLYLHTSRNTSQWDTCAPDVILREAGGRMTDLFNAPLRYNGPEVRNLQGVIASNGTIHERIAEAAAAALPGKL